MTAILISLLLGSSIPTEAPGIPETYPKADFGMYYKPDNKVVEFKCDGCCIDASVTDIAQNQLEEIIISDGFSLDISDYPSGQHFIRIKYPGKTVFTPLPYIK